MRSLICAVGVLAALVPFIVAGDLHADAIIFDSFSATSGGRGGVNLAHSDNGAILLENPANMIAIKSPRLIDMSTAILYGDLDYTDPDNVNVDESIHLIENPSAAAEVAYIQALEDDRFAWGVGVFVTGGFGTFNRQNTTFAGRQTYSSFAALVKTVVGASLRINDQLTIGGHVGLASHQANLDGPLAVQTGPLAGTPTIASLDVYGFAPAWAIGLRYEFDERTTIGIAYTGETRFSMRGDARLDVYGLGPAPIRSDFDADVSFAYPRSLGVGIQHALTPRHRLGFDFIWYNWSQAMDRIDLKFSNATSPVFAGTPLRDRLPLDWRDTYMVRLGYEYDLSPDLTLRLGYVYHRSPVPDATLTTYIPATTEHDITAGLSYRYRGMYFDFAYMFAFGPEREVRAEESQIVGGDFDDSTLRNQYHVFWLGVRMAF